MNKIGISFIFILLNAVAVQNLSSESVDLSPQSIVNNVNNTLKKVKSACVYLKYKAIVPGKGKAFGKGSGTLISPDGYILTAAHVVCHIHKKNEIAVYFDDKSKKTATLLGYDETSDLALLKLNGDKKDYPFAKIAKKSPDLGAIVFIYARPIGVPVEDPPQLRIGRIKGRRKERSGMDILNVNMSCLPGDSGSGLFNLNGELVGTTSASNGIGLTHFAAIEMYHRTLKDLKAEKRWGDKKNNPCFSKSKQVTTTDPVIIKRMIATLKKQLKDNYRPVFDKYRQAQIRGKKIQGVGALSTIDQMLLLHTPISYGLDDPVITKQIPKTIPKGSPRAFPVTLDKKKLTYGFPVSTEHVILKLSEIKGSKSRILIVGRKGIKLKLVGEDPKWDLALLELDGGVKFPSWKWPEKNIVLTPGTPLMSRDALGRLSWGITTDSAHPIKTRTPIPEWIDASKISEYRSPYPNVVRHTLPLYASEAGTPIYSFKGELLGLHMGRIGTPFGVMILIEDIQKSYKKMLSNPMQKIENGENADSQKVKK